MGSTRYVRKPAEIRIAPSILSADFSRLGEQVVEVDEGGADMVHIDVMDGHFVPNLTIGPGVIASIRRYTELPFDVHLMIENPFDHLEKFVSAGADLVTVHAEAKRDVNRCIKYLKDCEVGVGVSLNPSTPLSSVSEILGEVDVVLLMTVNPGFGGQEFMESVVPKLEKLHGTIQEKGLSIDVEVDGGVNAGTIATCSGAGANVLVAGSAVFNGVGSVAESIAELRRLAHEGIAGKTG